MCPNLLLLTELTYLIPTASILDAPEDDAAFRGGSHHLVLVTVRAANHLCVECDAFNGPVQVGGGEHMLPARRFFYPVRPHASTTKREALEKHFETELNIHN